MNNLNKHTYKVLLQITSGRGPAECCWVVAQVLKYLLEDLKSKGSAISYTIIDREEGVENGTLVSATLQVEGKTEVLNAVRKGWVGTIQWIGQSAFRKHHKRKNWFVGINELEVPPDMEQVRPSDLKFQSIRSGGPGGQNVNKVNTAVRVTHLPTGISVLANDSRTQHQNKKAAEERLKAKLALKSIEDTQKLAQSEWQNHNELERGNPVKVFKGTDFKPKHEKDKNKTRRKKNKQKLKNGDYDFFDVD